jgi:outer membrane receptor protein involved in Fe transport
MVWENEKWLVSVDNTWYSDSKDWQNAPYYYVLNDLKSIWYTDIQVRYFPSENWQLYVGLDNAFEEQPPYCPGCNNEPVPGAHYSGFQLRPWDSRFYYFGAKYSWGKD